MPSFKSIQFEFGNNQDWPELKANNPNELSLTNANFNLEPNRKVLFGGNGQISAVGDLSFLTGAPSPTEQLRIFTNGNIGIGTGTRQPTDKLEVAGKIQATDLEVSGTVKAKSFIGEFPGLTEKVSKTGDTMTGSLTIEKDLTVTGTVKGKSFSGEFPGLTEKVSKTGDTMTGSLTIEKDLAVSGNLKLGDLTINKFSSDRTLNGNSDLAIPTEKAIKTYVDTKVGGIRSSQWSESGGNLVYNVGNNNVGIGISQPSTKLEVAGNLKLQAGVAINQFSSDVTLNGNSDLTVPTEKAVKTYIDSKLTGGTSQWSNGTNGSISYIKGNVGIGTKNPQHKLHVAGNLSVSGNVKITSEGATLTVDTVIVDSLKIKGPNGQLLTISHDTVNWAFQTEPNNSRKTMYLHGGDSGKEPVWFVDAS